EAQSEEKKALTIDPKFAVAHGTLGDALALSGKGKEARKEYAFLEGAEDPALHHDGAMRLARVSLFEDRSIEAEKAMIKEAAAARAAGRPAEAAEAFLEAARAQIERGALGEAARGLKEAADSLARPKAAAKDAAPLIDEDERQRLGSQLMEERAMALAALGER